MTCNLCSLCRDVRLPCPSRRGHSEAQLASSFVDNSETQKTKQKQSDEFQMYKIRSLATKPVLIYFVLEEEVETNGNGIMEFERKREKRKEGIFCIANHSVQPPAAAVASMLRAVVGLGLLVLHLVAGVTHGDVVLVRAQGGDAEVRGEGLELFVCDFERGHLAVAAHGFLRVDEGEHDARG